MPKRTSKKQLNTVNPPASSIVQETTQKTPTNNNAQQKNPAAVALGRLGGLKGGKVRAEKLSPAKRKAIARKAAAARWAKRQAAVLASPSKTSNVKSKTI